MKVIEAYLSGWKRLFQNKRYWLLFYATNFVLAFVGAASLTAFMGKNAAHSLSISESLNSFNYPFLADFWAQYGTDFAFLQYQYVGLLGLFFILNIFLIGGLLTVFKNESTSWSFNDFWSGGARYFWRLFRLSAYFLLLQGLLLYSFIQLGSGIAKGFSILDLYSEFDFINALKWMVPLYLVLATLISLFHDYVKIHTVYQDRNWLARPVWESTKMTFKNLGIFFSLYALNILTLVFFGGIYWLLANNFSAGSFATIALLFVFGQVFLLLRIGLKIANLAGVDFLYREKNNLEPVGQAEGINQKYNNVLNPKAEAI